MKDLCSDGHDMSTLKTGESPKARLGPGKIHGRTFAADFFGTNFGGAVATRPFDSSRGLARFAEWEALKMAESVRLVPAKIMAGTLPPFRELVPGLQQQLESFTVHVSENGMVDNEVTFVMTKLHRNILQANLLTKTLS